MNADSAVAGCVQFGDAVQMLNNVNLVGTDGTASGELLQNTQKNLIASLNNFNVSREITPRGRTGLGSL